MKKRGKPNKRTKRRDRQLQRALKSCYMEDARLHNHLKTLRRRSV
jgi:hypothetical protein